MDVKTTVEEKRVKSTIIRRRAKVESAPPAPIVSAEPSVEAAEEPKKETVSIQAPKQEIKEPTTEAVAEKATTEKAAEEARAVAKRAGRKLSKEELEMEMIERAGGIKRVALMADMIPERLERVFKPTKSSKNSKKRKMLGRREVVGGKKTEITTPKASKRVLRIEGSVLVSDLAHRMGTKVGDVMKKLMDLNVMVTANERVDVDTATLVAQEFSFEVENVSFAEKTYLKEEETKSENLKSRPPVVTVMGHVDHGKTSLLDAIRKTKVAAGEAGGITQHIGGYKVALPKGTITFVDTPGHEAFTAMRARGAQVTDIVVLVVAADDGVMPQTVEAIHHAKAAKVPLIVAVNKIDKPDANQDRVERGLMEHGLVSEKLGGDIILVPVSAKTGKGIDDLLEMILLQAEVLDLKADAQKRGRGIIIEAKLDKFRGPVATVIVQEGTIKVGQPIVAGHAMGKVKALVNEQGKNIDEAGPSDPVEILGLSKTPMAGDTLHVANSDEDVRILADYREQKERTEKNIRSPRATLEDLLKETEAGGTTVLQVIVKADVQGSLEAIRDSLSKIGTEQVKVNVLHTGVGAVSESDVMLAVASKAVIIGFNVRPDTKARSMAENQGIQIKTYSIIYELIDEVKRGLEGLLKPTFQERYLGRTEVRQVYVISKVGTVAGCLVVDGKIMRTANIRVLREGVILHEGKLASLKRFKDDVREVPNGMECGLGVEGFNDIKVGDLVEAYQIEKVAGRL